MKRVKLDFGSEITISDEAFEQISAIVKTNRVCEGCGNRMHQSDPTWP